MFLIETCLNEIRRMLRGAPAALAVACCVAANVLADEAPRLCVQKVATEITRDARTLFRIPLDSVQMTLNDGHQALVPLVAPADPRLALGKGTVRLRLTAVERQENGSLLIKEGLIPDELIVLMANDIPLSEGLSVEYAVVDSSVPKTSYDYLFRGRRAMSRQNYSRAAEEFGKGIELDGNAGDLYGLRGSCYLELGDSDKALGDFEQAVRLAPGTKDHYYRRGHLYMSRGMYAAAIENYKALLKLLKTDEVMQANVHAFLGTACRHTGNYEEAIREYTAAIDLDRKNYNSDDNHYFNRGLALLEVGLYEGALGDFKKAQEINPQSLAAKREVALTRYLQGQLEESQKLMEATGFNEVPDYLLKLKIYQELGRTEKVEQLRRRIQKEVKVDLRRKPSSRECAEAAELFSEAGVRLDEAVNLALKAVELDPDDANYRVLALCHLRKGDKAAAMGNFAKSLEINPNNVDSLYGLGIACLAGGEQEAARKSWQKALRVNPQHRWARQEMERHRW